MLHPSRKTFERALDRHIRYMRAANQYLGCLERRPELDRGGVIVSAILFGLASAWHSRAHNDFAQAEEELVEVWYFAKRYPAAWDVARNHLKEWAYEHVAE